MMIEPDSLLGPLRERVDRLNGGASATLPAVAATATEAPAPAAAPVTEPSG
jgi:hypothetical protein